MRARTLDARGKPATRRIERAYRAKLRRVARHIGHLVEAFDPVADPDQLSVITRLLAGYAESLRGWAEITGGQMVTSADRADVQFWLELAAEMSHGIRETLRHSSVQPAMSAMIREQAELITSLPTKAAERVGHLTQEALAGGTRANEIAKEIKRTGAVTESRAVLIARTEVARTAATLTKARAEMVGSVAYIWKTSQDEDVRYGHQQMAGKICYWAEPPAVNEGTKDKPRWMHHGPGEIWSCRCWAKPILPE
jgi:SPP1 gp7 family putative phage head morphogenesis protein